MQLFHSDSHAPSKRLGPQVTSGLENATSPSSTGAPKIVVVGAGMSGLVTAMHLARRGCTVDIYEKRDQPSSVGPGSGRSMNLTLCHRGLKALLPIGCNDRILAKAKKLSGRAVHLEPDNVDYQAYGSCDHEVLYAIRRFDLLGVLLEETRSFPNIRIHYSSYCAAITKDEKIAYFTNAVTGLKEDVHYDLLVGADGVHSNVRSFLQDTEDYLAPTQSRLAYKELLIQPRRLSISTDQLHVWPRKDILLIGIPNIDDSITCNIFMPAKHFAELTSHGRVADFLQIQFPELRNIKDDLSAQFLKNPVSSMFSIRLSQWHYKNSIALIGDASHGVLPFLGQGVNAAFEDALTLNKLLDGPQVEWSSRLESYEKLRRPNADALATLVDEHLLNLKNESWTNRFERFLESRSSFLRLKPIYHLIAHTDLPYTKILWKLRIRRFALHLGAAILFVLPVFLGFLVALRLWGKQ